MTMTKKAILTMGLPGSGKSYVISKTYNTDEFTVIDPDEIKKEQPGYDDNNPSQYHEWSKREATLRIAQAVADGKDIIIDGTGTNVEKMYRQIQDLQANGYSVELLYTKVKLATALHRNQERPRTVPEHIIHEKFETLSTAFEILSSIADTARIVVND